MKVEGGEKGGGWRRWEEGKEQGGRNLEKDDGKKREGGEGGGRGRIPQQDASFSYVTCNTTRVEDVLAPTGADAMRKTGSCPFEPTPTRHALVRKGNAVQPTRRFQLYLKAPHTCHNYADDDDDDDDDDDFQSRSVASECRWFPLRCWSGNLWLQSCDSSDDGDVIFYSLQSEQGSGVVAWGTFACLFCEASQFLAVPVVPLGFLGRPRRAVGWPIEDNRVGCKL